MAQTGKGLNEETKENATLERDLRELTKRIRVYLDELKTETQINERRNRVKLMVKDIDDFREQYGGQIPEDAAEDLKAIRHAVQTDQFLLSVLSPTHKAMNASCKYNKQSMNETVGNAWIQDEQYIQMGEVFDRKINNYNLYTQKLFMYIIGEFYSQKGKTARNSHDPDYFNSRRNSTVTIGLADFFRLTGEDVFLTADKPLSDNEIKTIKNNRKNALRKLRESVNVLGRTSGWIDTKSKHTTGAIFENIEVPNVIGNIETAKMTIGLSRMAAEYYSTGRYVVTTHSELYSLPNTKGSRVSFALGMLISQRYYTYNNHQGHNNPNRLLIGKQLSNLPLPGKNDTDNPRKMIVLPVMKALEQLMAIGFLAGYKLVPNTKGKTEEQVLYSSYTEDDTVEYFEQQGVYNSMTYDDLAGCYLDFDIANPKDISEAAEANKKKYDRIKKADARARQKKVQNKK